ncbi:MAG TPA: Gfo/Idh/MocA family oxidoreductase [Fimbriimonadaceae bacterium]|nr:Gfo/Idh/MocA family oxidoreductase [Fimbriimonadaceae bacterium]
MAKKLKIGIIGSGGIAQNAHMKGYASIPELCEMVAVCDVNPETAKTAAQKFSVGKTYSDYGELLRDPEIDAVSVATPNKYHLQPTVDALRAGKHVLCEKPLGMNADECRQMCRAAQESGKILQVGLNMRFSGQARFLKEYIDSGGLGDIYYARAQALRRRGVPGWGVFIDKEQQGGGPLIDIGVHILDLTLFLMGYPKPVVASGKTWNTLGKNPDLWNAWGDYDRSKFTVEDFAVGLIKFDNGAVVVLESSFMANLDGDPFQAQLFGTRAGAQIKGWGEDAIEIYTEQNRQLFNMKPKNVPNVESTHVDEVKAFVDAILTGKPSPVPGENGLVLNAIFDALYKSSESGREEAVLAEV